MSDPIATPIATDLLGALLDAYDAQEALPAPCMAGLIAGAGIAADFCCAGTRADGVPCVGQLTVRVAGVVPTQQFPAARQSPMPVCGSSWAVELEIAVLRCAPAMDDTVDPPLPPAMADQEAAAGLALDDAALVRDALTGFALNRDLAHLWGPYSPLGPEGGCVGWAMTCTFLIE